MPLKKIRAVHVFLLFFQVFGVEIRELMDSVFISLSGIFMTVVIKTSGFIYVVSRYIHLSCIYYYLTRARGATSHFRLF